MTGITKRMEKKGFIIGIKEKSLRGYKIFA